MAPKETELKGRLRQWVEHRQRLNETHIEVKHEEEDPEDGEVELERMHEIMADSMLTIFTNFLNPLIVVIFWWFYD